MRNPGGWLIIQGLEQVDEYDTFTCVHCNAVHIVKHGQRPEDVGGFCKCCMGIICPRCVAEGTCTPLEKRLQMLEAKKDTLRSYGMG